MQYLNKTSSLTRYLIFFFFLLTSLFVRGQKHFDFNTGCRQAYQEIIRLKLDAGQVILDNEKKKDPDNLIPYFLENYIDFFVLFFNEDPSEYKARKGNLDKRIEWMNEGPESSPFYLFTKSLIHFQWAAVKIKFGNNWAAGWEFRRSFLEVRENQQKFPGFPLNTMLSATMQVVSGTIPDGYKWLSNLLGIKGNIKTGMQDLSGFLILPDTWATLYHDEAIFYFLYLKFYIENQRAEVFAYIRQNRLDLRRNHLYAYLASNLAVNDQQSAYVQEIIRQKSSDHEYLDMPVWDLEMGYARMNHLDIDANVYLERFIRRFQGAFYVKDALQKLSWFYYLQGDQEKANQFRAMIQKQGSTVSDADKQALREAGSGVWPDKGLLRARLLCDGGYYFEALQCLQGQHTDNYTLPEQKVELTYRLARIYDGLGRQEEAIAAYLSTIRAGGTLTAYYAARAALQIGTIYEKGGDRKKAIEWFQKCLSLKDHEYKNSLDQKAKAGIARCSE